MKNKLIPFIIAIIGIALLIAFLLKKDEERVSGSKIESINGKPYEVIKHEIDTLYLTKTKTKYLPGDSIYVETVVEKEVPVYTYMKVDTAAILKQYYSKYVYKDTLKLDDKLGYVSVTDTVTQNKITSRNWKYDIRERVLVDTKIVKELPKREYYVGAGAGFNKSDIFHNVSAGFLYKSKRNDIYQLSLGITKFSKPYIGFGTYVKIGK